MYMIHVIKRKKANLSHTAIEWSGKGAKPEESKGPGVSSATLSILAYVMSAVEYSDRNQEMLRSLDIETASDDKKPKQVNLMRLPLIG
jgi:hypothetical protein